VYISIGTIVVILLVVLIIMVARGEA